MKVTLITGFLGAGKTTFLSRLIREHSATRKLGVIVNDLSELEVDGELLREGHHVSEKEGTLISLFKGSISSDRSADFSKAISEMAERKLEHILVETSGGSHPSRIIDELRNAKGVELGAVATLVDARALYHDYQGGPGLVRQLVHNEEEGESTAENLLADQIQAASVLVLTKIDLVPADALELLFQSVSMLNPSATLVACAYGKLDASVLFDAPPYQPTVPRLTVDPDSLPKIESIVIRDPRPLHPQRFLELYQNHLTLGIYRSKGFIWLASRPDQVLLWNQAGGAMGIELLATWRSHILATDQRLLPEEKAHLQKQMKELHPDFGDRNCEVTVIGNEAEVRHFAAKFKSCFCTADEIDAWKKDMEFPDPWPKNLKML